MRRRRQGRRLRARDPPGGAGAQQSRLPKLLRRRPVRGGGRPGGMRGRHDPCAKRPPARHRRHLCQPRADADPRITGRDRRMGGILPERRGAVSGSAPFRHRHQPPRAAGCRGRRDRAQPPPCRFRAGTGDEPFRQLRGAGKPAERPTGRCVSRPYGKLFRKCRRRSATRPASSCRKSRIRSRPPGYALYGGNPTPGRSQPDASGGPARGAASSRSAPRRTATQSATTRNGPRAGARRLATISVGYADGYPRAASATDAKRDAQVAAGAAIVAGLRCPFAGRVSMDLIVVDITEVPAGAVRRGDLATLIGDDLTDRRGRPRAPAPSATRS